jgi:hypothetical protein
MGECMKRARELQIQIDDVHACHGMCPGCILTSGERKVMHPDMREDMLDLTIVRLREYALSLPRLNRVNVTFGIGDHLIMSESYIRRIHAAGASVIRDANPVDRAHSAVFFTTSLIGKPNEVLGKLSDCISSGDADVPLLPIVVLDPRLLHAAKFGPVYKDMISSVKNIFGKVDLTINLSDEAVADMGPSEFVEFAASNGFDEVTVNWSPTMSNAKATCSNLPATLEWLLGFDDLMQTNPGITSSFHPVLAGAIDAAMCNSDGGLLPSLIATVEGVVPETIRKSIQIDNLGNILPKFEAIGDLTHSPRFGLKGIGHVRNGAISDQVETAIPGLQRRIVSAHRHRQCMACPVSGICGATGFHVLTHVMGKTGMSDEGRCPHVARSLIDRLLDRAISDDEQRLAS